MSKIGNFFSAVYRVALGKDKPKPKTKREAMSKTEITDFYSDKSKAKELATTNGEPWVGVIDLDVDYENLSNGSFELDWNEKFLADLLRAGYVGKTDSDVVDQWFTNICRNVVLETYEQAEADPRSRELGGGRREYK